MCIEEIKRKGSERGRGREINTNKIQEETIQIHRARHESK